MIPNKGNKIADCDSEKNEKFHKYSFFNKSQILYSYCRVVRKYF